MIQDSTLRELFKAESEEHLQHLDEALLQLEKTPADQALLEEAFREAHSLKGAARMLGLSAIQGPAHRLEDQLNAARRAAPALDTQMIALMASELSVIRELTLQALASGAAKQHASTLGAPTEPLVPQVTSAPRATVAEPPGSAPTLAAFQIESVRVDTKRLDSLMTHAGELLVTGGRLAHRLTDLDDLIERNQEWLRSEGARRAALSADHAALDWLISMGESLAELRSGFEQDSARLNSIAVELESGIRQSRLLALSNVFRLFPRLVHDLAQEQGKQVELLIEGEEVSADKRILEELKDPLMHLLRNAIDHGIDAPAERQKLGKPASATLRIKASQSADNITIEVSDDGRGLNEEALRQAAARLGIADAPALAQMSTPEVHALIFHPGMSTAGLITALSGRGVGMGVVQANVARLKGVVELASMPGQGTRFTLRLPITLASARLLITRVNGHTYGLPMAHVQRLKTLLPSDLFSLEGRSTLLVQGQPVSAAHLADLLQLPQSPNAKAAQACVQLSHAGESLALLVDELVGEQEVLLKPQSALLERVRNISGAALLDSGEICLLLHVPDLLSSVRLGPTLLAVPDEAVALEQKKTILLVEDSLATRTLEARILEQAGYQVVSAADGLQAWNQLGKQAFDAVVTDIMMPKLSGLELAEKIRLDARYAELPIILVTSLASDEDRRRGLEAGANAYLPKGTFDQQLLLDCLERLI